MDDSKISQLSIVLAKQIDKDTFKKKYASARTILIFAGAGLFLAGSLAIPSLPMVLKPFIKDNDEYESWRRFNIPYLKRTIKRLEKAKLVQITEENGKQVVRVTKKGKNKIIRFSIENLKIEKPKIWDNKWRLISFDLPEKRKNEREIFVKFLRSWDFYPLHKSVYLHAYPCFRELKFLREYLGVSEYVKIFLVKEIENKDELKNFFNV